MFISGENMSENKDNMELIPKDQIQEITPEPQVNDIDLALEMQPSKASKRRKEHETEFDCENDQMLAGFSDLPSRRCRSRVCSGPSDECDRNLKRRPGPHEIPDIYERGIYRGTSGLLSS